MSSTSPEGVIACNTILPVLGIIVVGLRFYVRSTQDVKLKIDDWLQIPPLVLFTGMAITALYGVSHHAFGYPTPQLPPNQPAESLLLCEKLWFIIQLLQIWALAVIKIAALFFYRRIFVPTSRNSILHWIIIGLMVLILVWAIGFTAFYIAACGSHISAAWSGFIGFATYCLRTEKFEQAYAISDFLIDTFLLAIPLPPIWSLHMNTVRKISVTLVFMFALIGYGASIARLVIFVQSSNNSLSTALPDIQTTDTQAVWFSALETGLAIFALNLTSIWPLVSKVSVESIVNSVRSVVSLGSNNSGPRSRTYNEIDSTNKRNQTAASRDDIELVPQIPNSKFEVTAGSDSRSSKVSHSQVDIDSEDGIRVQKSVNITGGPHSEI